VCQSQQSKQALRGLQERKPMNRLSKYRVLFAGIVSPFAAFLLYGIVYSVLTERSTDREKDWLFRLTLSTIALAVPFLITLALFVRDQRKGASTPSRIGLILAVLSLCLAWTPVRDGILRSKQSRNLAMRDVAAPTFDTVDISGKTQRLADYKGQVVLVNIWATWCAPCRAEMPHLDQLYRERKDKGFVVFGLSDEEPALQRRFIQQVPVSYPLLTQSGTVPSIYRDIARYPAIFLIDRKGRLEPAPSPDQPFEKVEAAVDELLNAGS
jgi:peroxiredoxin